MHTGYKEIVFSDEQMAKFYQGEFDEDLGLIENEYLVILDANKEIKDVRKYKGGNYVHLKKVNMKSLIFGDKFKPKDIYQQMAFDSLVSDKFTAITGRAGSGKSLISLLYAMYAIDKGEYDKLIVMFNPVKLKNAEDMGFYAGDFQSKAMQQSVGNIMITKFGKRDFVETLISQEKLQLVSMADCRGMEIKSNEILFITEAQNSTPTLIGTSLSRVEEGAKVIIEGDYKVQVDSRAYEKRNGLYEAIELFKGHDVFSCVELQATYRSKIAELAYNLMYQGSEYNNQ